MDDYNTNIGWIDRIWAVLLLVAVIGIMSVGIAHLRGLL
jgi:hypothetical protein